MKIRKDFVTNSSSSSFICEICGKAESGWDCSLEEAEMVECHNGHIFCEYHLEMDFDNNDFTEYIIESFIEEIEKLEEQKKELLSEYKKIDNFSTQDKVEYFINFPWFKQSVLLKNFLNKDVSEEKHKTISKMLKGKIDFNLESERIVMAQCVDIDKEEFISRRNQKEEEQWFLNSNITKYQEEGLDSVDDEFLDRVHESKSEIRYNLPSKLCPICQLKEISNESTLKFIQKTLGIKKDSINNYIQKNFQDLTEFNNWCDKNGH